MQYVTTYMLFRQETIILKSKRIIQYNEKVKLVVVQEVSKKKNNYHPINLTHQEEAKQVDLVEHPRNDIILIMLKIYENECGN